MRTRSTTESGPRHRRCPDGGTQYHLENQLPETPHRSDALVPPSATSTDLAVAAAQTNGNGSANLAATLSPITERDTTARIGRGSVPRHETNKRHADNLIESLPEYIATMVCQSNLPFMRNLKPNSIKLIVTSPPYNIGKNYETRKSLDAYIEEQRRVVDECVRVLHPRGSICWQVGNYVNDGEIFPLDILLYDIFKDAGLKLRNRIIWQFEHGLHCKKRLSGRHETILWFTKSDKYTFHLDPIRVPQKYPNKKHHKGPNLGKRSCNPLGKNPGDVWNIPNVKHNHIEKTLHPCQFPIELVERLVLSLTECGDSVLDPYMGVGSAVLAAVKHNRNGLGCDVVSEYVDTARNRLQAFEEGRFRTRPMNRPIYEPSSERCK